MKFTVNSKDLATRLGSVSRVQNSKNALPILNNILFQVRDGELTLTASDSELYLSTSMPVTDSTDGMAAIESKQLLSAIKEISDRPIFFDINPETFAINVDYGNGKYNFIGLPGDEFPLPQPIQEAKTATIPGDTVLAGINLAVGAMADDELRPQMNGIYFDDTPTGFNMVASDGHKLSKYTKKGERKGINSFIVPAKAARLLKNLLKEGQTLSFQVGERNFRIDGINGYVLSGRIVEGLYPNYEAVIPKNYTKGAVFNRQDAIGALRRVGVFSNTNTGLVKLALTGGDKLVISAKDINFSTSAEETITADYSGEDFAIGAHIGYLSEELGVIKTDEVEMKYLDPARAIVILPVTDEDTDEEFVQLLMPMMLND